MTMPTSMVRQAGISLVEIMVALVAGLILTAGIVQISAANKRTYRVAEASGRIQEDARFAIQFLGTHIRMAGYRHGKGELGKKFAEAFPLGTYGAYSHAAGEVIRGGANEIVIRYQGDGIVRRCDDFSIVPINTMSAVRFYLSNGTLYCDADLNGGQPLVSGVSQMTVLYGVDTDGDGSANCFDSATNLNNGSPTACGQPATAPWSEVVSVRITLTMSFNYDESHPDPANRLQKTYTTTIAMRNRVQ